MSDWQPIETLPNDSDSVLILINPPAAPRAMVVGFRHEDGTLEDEYSGYDVLYATHWQPLPNPPEVSDE